VRRATFAAFVALTSPVAADAATVTLGVSPGSARPGTQVTFAGRLLPTQAGAPAGLYVKSGTSWTLVASASTAADGSFAFAQTARRPGAYMALVQTGAATQVASGEVALRIRPRLTARILGRRVVGARLRLTGRLQPADAGRLTFRMNGVARRVRVGPAGRFSLLVPNTVPGRRGWRLALAPAPGYERAARRNALLLRAPALGRGSAGAAVRALEARLARLRYAVRLVNSYYGSDTYEAVLAFQKVHGLRRTGSVSAEVWRRLARARVPRAHVPSGTHIEISKTRQVMFEVVDGEVVKAVHVSTGATGNTPVGRWRVYRLGPGFNALGMYYSVYFLRGFAIHGYRSVPPFPASHGCVRTPIWFAPGFYRRWGRVGTQIMVFP
jgi:Putative peptidoglycan binding domain/L,D-transpeptidase catalytic domain